MKRKRKKSSNLLVDVALDAIRDVFADTTVSKTETAANLRYLIDEIYVWLDSLKE